MEAPHNILNIWFFYICTAKHSIYYFKQIHKEPLRRLKEVVGTDTL